VRDYVARQPTNAPPLRPDRVYIAFTIIESGDAPSYLENRQWEVWADPRRGAIPINWSMGPGVLDLMPPVAAWYFRHATPNDHIFAALSGVGYTHPYRSLMARTPDPEAAWARYLELTGESVRRLGCGEIGLYTDAWLPFDRAARDPITRRYAGIPGVEMLLLGMGRDEGVDPDAGSYRLGANGTLVSHVMTRWPLDYSDREANIRALVADVRAHTPKARPGFMVAMALSWAYGPTEIAEVLSTLGEEYVPVTLPQYRGLLLTSGGQAPAR
jgi:hypothetical protein